MKLPPELSAIAEAFPYRLLFATVSGAHLYGFPSPDSDFDLRGCHVVPVAQLLGLRDPEETEERLGPESGLALDLVSHDVRKFCRLLLTRNGYVLEQLLSPLIVQTTPEHAELKSLVPRLVTKHHAHHYLGFARNQWRLFERDRRVKSLLYVYRVLLTGLHLMLTGRVEAALPVLLEAHPWPGIRELIQRKTAGAEHQSIDDADLRVHERAFEQLVARLEAARDASHLPEEPTAFAELDELVRRVRLTT